MNVTLFAKKNICKTVFNTTIIAGALLLANTLAVSAQDTYTHRRVTITNDGTTTTTTTTTEKSKKPEVFEIAGIPVKVSSIWQTLENRRQKLDHLVSKYAFTGKLNETEAGNLRHDLDLIESKIVYGASHRVSSLVTVTELAQNLDKVASKLNLFTKAVVLPNLVVVDTTTNAPRLITGVFGDFIAVDKIDAKLFRKTLALRKAKLKGILSSGQTTGTISEWQANNLRAELDRLSRLEEDIANDGFITREKAIRLALEYDHVRNEISRLVDLYDVSPMVRGSRIILTDNKVVAMDDIMVRRANLEDKISHNLASRNITNGQARELREKLDTVAKLEESYRDNGKVSDKEAHRLYSEYDKVGSSVDKAIN